MNYLDLQSPFALPSNMLAQWGAINTALSLGLYFRRMMGGFDGYFFGRGPEEPDQNSG